MKVAFFVLAFVLVVLDDPLGCDKPPAKPVVAQAKRYPPIHRFENVSNQSPGIALDTVTGQYCKTWEWTYKVNAMNGGLDTLPTCLSIFQSTPSDTNGTKTGDKEIDSLPDAH